MTIAVKVYDDTPRARPGAAVLRRDDVAKVGVLPRPGDLFLTEGGLYRVTQISTMRPRGEPLTSVHLTVEPA